MTTISNLLPEELLVDILAERFQVSLFCADDSSRTVYNNCLPLLLAVRRDICYESCLTPKEAEFHSSFLCVFALFVLVLPSL